ncbi:MAG TPA: YkgJ family cysteine cluster protein [Vineibacter sp.]|nr:YkgJ family cysteine cluster protein [Vineibacter sp.]
MSDSGPGAAAPPQQIAMTLRWDVGDKELPLEFSLPAQPVEPQAILPALRQLVNDVVAASVEELENHGRHVTCKAGCGACCRQVVPIADFEAHAIAALIENMPEERRNHVRERFADAERRLAAARPPDEMIAAINGDDRYDFAVEYFKIGVACPFLEDESCSIYTDRPLICREYLVYTPVERCAKVGEPGIGVVPINRASKALYRLSTMHNTQAELRVPLSLVPYWTARNPARFPMTNGAEWVMRFVAAMAQADAEEARAEQRARESQSTGAGTADGAVPAPDAKA